MYGDLLPDEHVSQLLVIVRYIWAQSSHEPEQKHQLIQAKAINAIILCHLLLKETPSLSQMMDLTVSACFDHYDARLIFFFLS